MITYFVFPHKCYKFIFNHTKLFSGIMGMDILDILILNVIKMDVSNLCNEFTMYRQK